MKNVCIFLGIGVVLALPILLWIRGSGKRATSSNAEDSPVVEQAKPFVGEPKWIGMTSCAAAGCHNANVEPGTPGSEFSTWEALDPHANAFRVLKQERSRVMVRRLFGEGSALPENQRLCLGCHDGTEAEQRAPQFGGGEGVGCESCHGPAERWVGLHHFAKWKEKTAADKARLGMRLLSDLVVRAETCTPCHVGRDANDVNHNLIAAGHPPLRFEVSSYLMKIPKHWDAKMERKERPDFEAQMWEVGQVVSAHAALRLLAARADRRDNWPEFAEYNCRACHHDLANPAWQDETDNLKQRRTGAPRMQEWYVGMIRVLAGRSDREHLVPSNAAIREVQEMMATYQPRANAVSRKAQIAADHLLAALPQLKRGSRTSKEVRALFEAFAGIGPTNVYSSNWEMSIQQLFSLQATSRCLDQMDQPDESRLDVLNALKAKLPRGFDAGAAWNK